MDDTKAWWQSRTIWASVLQVALMLAVTFGLISSNQSAALLAELPDWILGIASTVAGGIAIWGRVRATKTIT